MPLCKLSKLDENVQGIVSGVSQIVHHFVKIQIRIKLSGTFLSITKDDLIHLPILTDTCRKAINPLILLLTSSSTSPFVQYGL
jgi:hypothetical protein